VADKNISIYVSSKLSNVNDALSLLSGAIFIFDAQSRLRWKRLLHFPKATFPIVLVIVGVGASGLFVSLVCHLYSDWDFVRGIRVSRFSG
jgi:hypothetical protein